MKFSNLYRHEITAKLKDTIFDVLVIGGGITGAGIALDAQTRGMAAAVIDMQDFSAGTSSRSTKLVHGGLRYLKQFEIKMVSEIGRERAIVYENGPHVTTPEWMLLPIYKEGTFGRFSTSIGLRLYDFLAAVKRSERRIMLNADETIAKEPLLNKEGLIGSGCYVEYRTDDARLTIEVLKAAVEQGATAINYTKVTSLLYDNGQIAGALVKDLITEENYKIYAKKVVNASGPWVDQIRELDHSKKGKILQLSKGVHVVIDQSKFPLKNPIYFDTPDGRMVFAIPREQKTYIGTTDTFYTKDAINPEITPEDRRYLVRCINFMFPDAGISEEDIESSWAGVRPLIFEEGKKPSEISRKDEVWESETGLLTIAGGKLTGYRKMAETVVNHLSLWFLNKEGRRFPDCQTKNFPISGGNVGGSANFLNYIRDHAEKGIEIGLTTEEADQLTQIYGSNIDNVFQLLEENIADADKYRIPLTIFAKLIYAIEYEMAISPVDFFKRRTGALFFNISLVELFKNQVCDYLAERFNWSEGRLTQYRQLLEEEIKAAVMPFVNN